jgi:hypothetical protein
LFLKVRMATANRNPEQRDDFLLETNFDEDGALTRAYPNSESSVPPVPKPRLHRSNYSIDRYSDAARSSKKGSVFK